MKNIINTRDERIFNQMLVELEENLKLLKSNGFNVDFYDSKVAYYKNIGNGLRYNDDLCFEPVQGSMRRVPSYAIYVSLNQQYADAIVNIRKYKEYLTSGELDKEKIEATIEQAYGVLNYTISDKGLYHWINTCINFLNYPISNDIYHYFVGTIYKLIKIEYQRNYSSKMLDALTSYTRVPFRLDAFLTHAHTKDEVNLELYNKINTLLEHDVEKCIKENAMSDDMLYFLNSNKKNIFNSRLLDILTSYETNDFTSLHEKVRTLEERVKELELQNKKDESIIEEEKVELIGTKSIFNIPFIKKKIDKVERKKEELMEHYINFNNINDGLYIVPLFMFRNSLYSGNFEYAVKENFDLIELNLGDENDIPNLTDSHVIVEVNSKEPNHVKEILTGMKIPVTYNYKFVPIGCKESIIDEKTIPENPAWITVMVDVLGREVISFDRVIERVFTSQFAKSDNNNLLNSSEDVRKRVLDYYRYLHPNVYQFEAQLNEKSVNAEQEYYRYLKRKVDAMTATVQNSDTSAIQYSKK